MQMNCKEMLEFVENTDLSGIVALDVSTFSKSLNCKIGGRVQRAYKNRMTIHTGIAFHYTIDLQITPRLGTDLYFVKKGKNKAEYVSHHFNIYLNDPFGNILVAIIDKIEKGGGILSLRFPSKRLSKCLSQSIIKVTDEDEDFEDFYAMWGGGYGNPYEGIKRSPYTKREKKFYFKEQGHMAIEAK